MSLVSASPNSRQESDVFSFRSPTHGTGSASESRRSPDEAPLGLVAVDSGPLATSRFSATGQRVGVTEAASAPLHAMSSGKPSPPQSSRPSITNAGTAMRANSYALDAASILTPFSTALEPNALPSRPRFRSATMGSSSTAFSPTQNNKTQRREAGSSRGRWNTSMDPSSTSEERGTQSHGTSGERSVSNPFTRDTPVVGPSGVAPFEVSGMFKGAVNILEALANQQDTISGDCGSSALSAGAAPALGGFYSPRSVRLGGGESRGIRIHGTGGSPEKPRAGVFLEPGSLPTTSLGAVQFGSEVPPDLPPESPRSSVAAHGRSLSEAYSLSRQRAIAERESVEPIHLDEHVSMKSFMSLSSVGVARSGSFQAQHSRTHSTATIRQHLATSTPDLADTPAHLHLSGMQDTLRDEGEGSETLIHSPAPDVAPDLKGTRRQSLPLLPLAATLLATQLPPSAPSEGNATYSLQRKSLSFAASQHNTNNSTRAPTPMSYTSSDRRGSHNAPSTTTGTSEDITTDRAFLSTLRPTKAGVPLDVYAAILTEEFKARSDLMRSEDVQREKLRGKEVSFYLWRARSERANHKLTHKSTFTIPSLEHEEKALFQTRLHERAERFRREHAEAMQRIAREVPPQRHTMVSRLSSDNTADLHAGTRRNSKQNFPPPSPPPARLTAYEQHTGPSYMEQTPQQTTLKDGKRSSVSSCPASPSDPVVDAEVARQVAIKRLFGRTAAHSANFFGALDE